VYTSLYRLERAGLIAGRWVEKAGQRRRRFYRLTPAGRQQLAVRRKSWREFVGAVDVVLRPA
jgi:DNA-binding PadR family transcriptional regulator